MKRAELGLCLAIGLCLLSLVPVALGPLQLGLDSPEYLAMAAVKVDGYPFPQTRLPIGYPALVAVMERGGVAAQAEFVVLNLIALALGLTAFFSLMRGQLSTVEILGICLATLLYRETFELAAIPQPDLPFFGVSMLALVCLAKPSSAQFIVGLALCALAVSLRSVGLALIPATAWAVFQSNRRAMHGCLAAGVWALILSTLVKWNGYVGGFAGPPYRSLGVVHVIWMDITWRFDEVATIATNLKHPFWHSLQVTAWICVFSAVFCLALLIGLWKLRRSIVAVYFASYMAILLVWPARMPRFWVPLMPLALTFAWVGGKSLAKRFEGSPKVIQAALAGYLLWFSAMGIDGIYREVDFTRGEAAVLLAKQRRMPHLTTSELAALNPPDLAQTPNMGLAANRYGGSQ
jgi:hypothetical protein